MLTVPSGDAYAVLGVPHGADAAALRRAFRALALKHHPDAVAQTDKEGAARGFARINQAYEVLRDPEKRKRYDGLLDRGITPDLDKEVGEVGLPSLADILGEIHSLGIEADYDALNRFVPMERARIQHDLGERAIDALRIARLVRSRGFKQPAGKLEAWLVVTNLRLILLMEFIRRYETTGPSVGGLATKRLVTERDIYTRSFPYLSLKNLGVEEAGRLFPSSRLELEDEDGTAFVLRLGWPRLTRLLLVSNVYRLPLRVHSRGSRVAEYLQALLPGLLPLLLWALAFAVGALAYDYSAIEKVLHARGLTTLAFSLSALLLPWLVLRVYRAWSLGRAEAVVGPLPLDFAAGPGGTVPVSPEPVSPPREPQPLKSLPNLPHYESYGAAAPPPSESRPPLPPSLTPDQAEGAGAPLEVDVPEAVREARSLSREAAPPEDERVPVFCPHCGKQSLIVRGWKDAVQCGQCGGPFEIET
jgi:hypothetical protein